MARTDWPPVQGASIPRRRPLPGRLRQAPEAAVTYLVLAVPVTNQGNATGAGPEWTRAGDAS